MWSLHVGQQPCLTKGDGAWVRNPLFPHFPRTSISCKYDPAHVQYKALVCGCVGVGVWVGWGEQG